MSLPSYGLWPAVGAASGARARYPAQAGRLWPVTKASVLACDQAVPRTTPRFTLSWQAASCRGAPRVASHGVTFAVMQPTCPPAQPAHLGAGGWCMKAHPPKQARTPPKASGAPGRGAAAQHVMPGYQACTFSVSQGDRPLPGGLTWPDTPPAAGRAWVPGCRARTLRRPYHRSTTKSPD